MFPPLEKDDGEGAAGDAHPAPAAPDPVPPVPPTQSSFDTSALTAPPPAAEPAPDIEGDPVKTLELKPKIVEQLVTVFDPEIPVNIYELGLIYGVEVVRQAGAARRSEMTLTAPGLSGRAVTLVLKKSSREVEAASRASRTSHVELVWDPPLDSRQRMTDAAKLQLGIFD